MAWRKTSHLPCFSSFSAASLSPFSFSAVPSATTTTVTAGWTTILSTTLLPLHWCFSLFLHRGSSSSAPPFSFSSFSSTGSSNISADLHLHNLLYHHNFHQPSSSSVAEQPPWPSLSSPSSFSLSSATFSSSSHSRLRPPSPQPKPSEPPARHPQHDQRPSPPQVVLLPALPPSSSRPLHVESIPACSSRIINMPLGRASFGPAQMARLIRPGPL